MWWMIYVKFIRNQCINMRIANRIEESTRIKSPHATRSSFLVLFKMKRLAETQSNRMAYKSETGLPKSILCFLFRRIQIRRSTEKITEKTSIMIILIWCEKRFHLHIAKLALPKKSRTIKRRRKKNSPINSFNSAGWKTYLNLHHWHTERHLDTHKLISIAQNIIFIQFNDTHGGSRLKILFIRILIPILSVHLRNAEHTNTITRNCIISKRIEIVEISWTAVMT